MRPDELHHSLERLRAELKRTEFRDPAARQHLQQLIAEIELHTADTGNLPQRQALLANLKDAIRRFEVEHPNFTGYLGQIVSSLSSMGI